MMMRYIFYCADKSSRNKICLPYPFQKISNLKSLKDKKFCIVIFDEKFLNKHRIDIASLSDKACFIYFPGKDISNIDKVKEHVFFDFLTAQDSDSELSFKIKRAHGFLDYKERISNLERELLNKDKKIKEIILIDPPTGCYNWRYFLHRARQELSRARRHLNHISFVVLDIDYFRQINELYGSDVADMVIREMVAILKGTLRREDIVTRWREDEFFIILPYLSRDNAYQVAKRIKDKISLHKFKYKKFTLNIKVSMGVVSFPGDNLYNTKDIISALHGCLTIAKRKGGDRVLLYSQPELSRLDKKRKTAAGVDVFRTKIEKLNALLTRDLLEMIYGFARAIEAKDYYTGKHVEYTALIAEKIAQELGLPASEIDNIKHAAVLHDLGKVGIDESILSKKGKLTDREREIIRSHPWTGAEILREIHALRGAIPAILYHHECFDGTGYPLGLKGDEIPLSARIVALADVYQALISDRPYRKAFSKQKAMEIIKKETGSHFDQKIVKIFFKVIKNIK
jgi:diguanylate cyclase (GGDEF)-like protein/putative nucleotidyltransferase with HDIG domain